MAFFSLRAGNTTVPLTVKEFLPSFEHPPLTLKQKAVERYGRDGAAITGDRRLASRKVKITIAISAKTDAEYDAKAYTLFGVLEKDDLYLYDDVRGYRIAISSGTITPKSDAWRRAELWVIDAIAQDAAWETIEPIIYQDEYADEYEPGFLWADGEQIILQNDLPLDAWPVFELTSQGPNSEFAIVNVTTGAVIRVGESQFTAGVKMNLDSRTGKATLIVQDEDDSDVSQKIADNTSFLILPPGPNILRYESLYGPVVASVWYRTRRPF